MEFFLFALISAVVGTVPILLAKRFKYIGICFPIYFFSSWLIFYAFVPSLVWPMGGPITIVTFIWTICSAVAGSFESYTLPDSNKVLVWAIPVVVFVSLFVSGCSGCAMFRDNDYAQLIGQYEKRDWTQDVQPKDPTNIRLVSVEAAKFLADKQLGSVHGGAIGSQFHVDKDRMILQIIRGELWYVAPLDFNGFFTWMNTDYSPGYVMVNGCDPYSPAKVVADKKFAYTPGAWFGKDLVRHLWNNGYKDLGLTDVSLELDDDLNPWWVVSVFKPTIGWYGLKALGVVVVDPGTGESKFYALGSIPNWIDRCIPSSFAEDYVRSHGNYSGGFWNTIFAKQNLTEPESPSLVYGSDHEPYWVMSVTSTSEQEQSMVGLFYIDSRTGKTIHYQAQGSTENGVLAAVNNKVAYKNWHGDSPVLYNIYNTMAYIVPVLGENHTFQAVAICDVRNMLVAEGKNELEAYANYQRLLRTSGQQITPEFAHQEVTISNAVSRIAFEPSLGNYYIYVESFPHIFTCGADLSPKVAITQKGDQVSLTYIDSPEDVIPLTRFDNKNIKLSTSPAQINMREKVAGRQQQNQQSRDVKDFRSRLQDMSDSELDSLRKKQ